MPVLLALHFWLRWAVILFGLVGAVRIILSRRDPERLARGAKVHGTIFLAALDTAWLVGIVLLLMEWGTAENNPVRLTHGAIMTAAVILAHGLRVATKRGNDRLLAALFLAPLVIILAGHLILP